ncbi:hypothetical protein RM69_04530, partial [Mesotoga sp. SC_NapDC3]
MIFLLLHYDLHQERRTDTRSGTNNGFSSENRSTVNQVLSFFPTPNPGLLLFLVSSPGGFHPQALSEPDLNLSIHPAPIIQPNRISPLSSVQIDEALCEQELLAIYPLLYDLSF